MIDRLVRFQSIRQRLLVSFAVLVALFCVAGLAGRSALVRMSGMIAETLESVQVDAQLSARLFSAVTLELAAAQRYLEMRDSSAQGEFRAKALEAHSAQRGINLLRGQSPREFALISSIDARLSQIEVRYARAHRLSDLGRREASLTEGGMARQGVDSLLEEVRQLGAIKSRNVDAASLTLPISYTH